MFGRNDLEEFKKRLKALAPIISSVNWKNDSYTDEKAYVAAVFSKIAYLKIPDYELKHHSAVKVIPCQTYQNLMTLTPHNITFNIGDVLKQIEDVLKQSEVGFVKTFVVTTEYAVVVGVVMNDVIIIALRGTVPTHLTDLHTDMRATKTLTYVNGEKVKFHTGFYLATVDCIEKINDEINNIEDTDIPIYVVGHSLGGAMAGILNSLSNSTFSSLYRLGQEITVKMNITSCFTIGMPRYGNSAIKKLNTPYHIYNENDVVPNAPPKIMLFSDVPNMYLIGKSSNVFKREILKILLVRFARHHFIDHYINLLENKLLS